MAEDLGEGWRQAAIDFRAERDKREGKQKPKRTPPPGGWPSWWEKLIKTERGGAIANLANVLVILRNDPAFEVCFAFDEMQQAAMVLAPPPICPDAAPGGDPPRLMEKEDVTRLVEWIEHHGIPRLARDHVEYALEEFCRERSIHPLRDWLNWTEWDGARRNASFLHHALGCPDDDYHREIGRNFLIAMVARIMEPGCQADYMIVLEGPQGEEKSRFCRALASTPYFSDAMPRLDTDRVRVSMHLRGKWLIEISELSAFNKSEAGALKSFISQRMEIYTPKYGHEERHEPRQCLFIGTTNDDEYIRDDTGGRRFWPVKVERVDLDWLVANRDQLFAEAVVDYRNRQPWWPDRQFEREVIAPLQAEKQVYDHWTSNVVEAATTLTTVSIAAIWNIIANTTDVGRLDMLAQKRIASILRIAGYRKGQDGFGRVVWRKSERF